MAGGIRWETWSDAVLLYPVSEGNAARNPSFPVFSLNARNSGNSGIEGTLTVKLFFCDPQFLSTCAVELSVQVGREGAD
jgi:hypothetical protein